MMDRRNFVKLLGLSPLVGLFGRNKPLSFSCRQAKKRAIILDDTAVFTVECTQELDMSPCAVNWWNDPTQEWIQEGARQSGLTVERLVEIKKHFEALP